MSTKPITKLAVDKLAKVAELILEGAELIAQQEALVTDLKEKGRDTVRAEDTLDILRCTQIIIQHYRLSLEGQSAPSREAS